MNRKLVCVIKWKDTARWPPDYHQGFFVDLWQEGFSTETDDLTRGYVTRVYKPCTS